MITLKGVDSKMIANNLIPSEPIHPGEILKDEIEYRGISQRKLARQMGISPTLLNEIVNGRTTYFLPEHIREMGGGVFELCGKLG